jgi:hypothetical protein
VLFFERGRLCRKYPINFSSTGGETAGILPLPPKRGFLGRVHTIESDKEQGEPNGEKKALVVLRDYPSEAFQPPEQPLHLIPPLI